MVGFKLLLFNIKVLKDLEFTTLCSLLNGNGEGRFFKGVREVCTLWVCYCALLIAP